QYWLAPFGALATLILFCFWPQSLGQKRDLGLVDIGLGERAPLDAECKNNVSILANRTAIVTDATLFSSLLFGGLFLLVVAPNWEDVASLDLPLWPGLAALGASFVGAGLA